MSSEPSRAEQPDDDDHYYQTRERPASDGRHQHVPRPRTHHDDAQQLPDRYAEPYRGPRHSDDVTLRVAGRDATRDGYATPARSRSTQARSRPSAAAMTAAATFWYVAGCIAMGGMYFAKVPCKKALEEAGLATMTSAERFWYVLGCVPLGAFYFCKLPVKKALTEAHRL